eukprot:TRINITY_DN8765_c0_g2_i1.p1 TRINITY_DN8765_c0_g2~~TRINITY_DN8765_c0_g2_i1.p1  ORF type:complete len:245 (+),score=24.12 TRINITY_DN8765_c0_g2_i1:54-788(+)
MTALSHIAEAYGLTGCVERQRTALERAWVINENYASGRPGLAAKHRTDLERAWKTSCGTAASLTVSRVTQTVATSDQRQAPAATGLHVPPTLPADASTSVAVAATANLRHSGWLGENAGSVVSPLRSPPDPGLALVEKFAFHAIRNLVGGTEPVSTERELRRDFLDGGIRSNAGLYRPRRPAHSAKSEVRHKVDPLLRTSLTATPRESIACGAASATRTLDMPAFSVSGVPGESLPLDGLRTCR